MPQQKNLLAVVLWGSLQLFTIGLSMASPANTSSTFVSNIFGGETAQPGEYPYFVQYLGCGGALIAPDVALSAAHCGNRTGQHVWVGAYRTLSEENGARKRTCVEWKAHPRYDPSTEAYDVALCKLDRPVAIDETRVKLVLNRDPQLAILGEDLVAMGFGSLDGNPQHTPTVLQHTRLQGRSCGGESSLYVCAGGPDNSNGVTDVCRGDSGGPLVKISNNSSNNHPILHYHVGTVSYGTACPTARTGVYARTSGMVSWIQRGLCEMESPACDPGLLLTEEEENSDGDGVTNADTICEPDQSRLVVKVRTDLYASENEWKLEREEEVPGNPADHWVEVASHDLPRDNTLEETTVCLARGSYRWTLTDTRGDGLCDPYKTNCGFFGLVLDGRTLVDCRYENENSENSENSNDCSGSFGSVFATTFGLPSSQSLPPSTRRPRVRRRSKSRAKQRKGTKKKTHKNGKGRRR